MKRELFTQYYTRSPSVQVFKRSFLWEMLMEDFWVIKHLFYLVRLQKQLK